MECSVDRCPDKRGSTVHRTNVCVKRITSKKCVVMRTSTVGFAT